MASLTNEASADAPSGVYGIDLAASLSTYTEVSRDTQHGVSMVESGCCVINYDDVARRHMEARGYTARLSSNDALYLEGEDKKPWFIEFKNGRIDATQLRQKVAESLLIAMDIGVLRDLKDAQQRAEYILVYNPENNNKNLNSLLHHAKFPSCQPYLLRTVERFAWLFKNVHSYTPDEFRTHFLKVKYEEDKGTV